MSFRRNISTLSFCFSSLFLVFPISFLFSSISSIISMICSCLSSYIDFGITLLLSMCLNSLATSLSFFESGIILIRCSCILLYSEIYSIWLLRYKSSYSLIFSLVKYLLIILFLSASESKPLLSSFSHSSNAALLNSNKDLNNIPFDELAFLLS